MKKLGVLLFLVSLMSCGSDDTTNLRAYVEGKAVSNVTAMEDIEFLLVSDGKTIAQTKPTPNGAFVLSGPLLGQNFDFKSNKKIKYFSSPQSGCVVSGDSLSVHIPSGISYLEISKIEVK